LLLFDGMYQAGRWPVTSYPGWLRVGFTFLVPLAFAITVPASALTGRLSASTLLGAAALHRLPARADPVGVAARSAALLRRFRVTPGRRRALADRPPSADTLPHLGTAGRGGDTRCGVG